jgi:hypothetical protein
VEVCTCRFTSTNVRPTENDILATVCFSVRLQKENTRAGERAFKSSDLEAQIKQQFHNLCITETQEFALDAGVTLILTATGVQHLHVVSSRTQSKAVRGILIESTNITLTKAPESSIKILGGVNTTYGTFFSFLTF